MRYNIIIEITIIYNCTEIFFVFETLIYKFFFNYFTLLFNLQTHDMALIIIKTVLSNFFY